ncbi:MAG: serine protease [Patescibacteria group bacterium]|nr:serine protease [Patescibacteria group bacterium]
MKNITIKSLREKQKDKSEISEEFFNKPKNEISELLEQPYKPKRIKRISSIILFILFVFFVGGTGGILIDRIILPSALIKYPELKQYEFLKRVNEGTTVVEIIKEIKISEDGAMVEAIKKVSPSVIEVLEFSNKNNSIYKGTGTILTSDGLIIVSTESITPNKTEEENPVIKVKLKNGKVYETILVDIDLSTGLAIIKIEELNLPVIPLTDSENIQLGEKIVIIDNSVVSDIVSKFIDDYVSFDEQKRAEEKGTTAKTQLRIKTVNSLKNYFYGSPVVNLKGEIIGISQGGDMFIPTNEIRGFIELAMDKEK